MFYGGDRLWIHRLPYRVLHGLHPVIGLLRGDAVSDCLFGNRNRNGGRRGAQVIDRRQERRAQILRVHLRGDRFGGGKQHRVGDVFGAAGDDAEAEAGIKQRVVALADGVVGAVVVV